MITVHLPRRHVRALLALIEEATGSVELQVELTDHEWAAIEQSRMVLAAAAGIGGGSGSGRS